MTAPSSVNLLKLYSRLALVPLTSVLFLNCGGKQSFTSNDVTADDVTADISDTETTNGLDGTDGSVGSDQDQTGTGAQASTDDGPSGATATSGGGVDGDSTGRETTASGTGSFDAGTVDDDAGQETTEDGTSETRSDSTTHDPNGTSSETTCGRPDTDYAALGKDCHLVDLNCDGVVFTDDCGCGCLTPGSDPTAGVCPARAGTPLDVQANAVHKLNCEYSFERILGLVLRSRPAYDQFVEQVLPQCGVQFDAPSIDFDSTMLFVAMVAERPDAEFLHAVVTTNQGIVVGFEGPAYCGGAAPPSSVFLLELPRSEHDVTYDVCYTGDCGDGPLPP